MTDQIDEFCYYTPSYISSGYEEIKRISSPVELNIVDEIEERELIIGELMLIYLGIIMDMYAFTMNMSNMRLC